MLVFVHSMLRFFTLSLPPLASTQSADKPTGGEGSAVFLDKEKGGPRMHVYL